MRPAIARPGKLLVAALGLLLAAPGCATITGGCKDQKVKIASNPPGAQVFVDGQPCGQTPTVVQVSRKTEHQVDVVAAGCEPAHVTLQRHLNPWLFGNILVGGLVGLTVDVCTDATHTLAPGDVAVNLRGAGVPAGYPGAGPGPLVPTAASGPAGAGLVPAGGPGAR